MPKRTKQFKCFYIIEVSCDTPLKHYVSILVKNVIEGLALLANSNEVIKVRMGKVAISKKNLNKLLGEITMKPYTKPKH